MRNHIWTLAILCTYLISCNKIQVEDKAVLGKTLDGTDLSEASSVDSNGNPASSSSGNGSSANGSTGSGSVGPGSSDSISVHPGDGATTPGGTGSNDGQNSKLETLSFRADTSYQDRELDIVWVIDNSGSMGEEIEHVRKNLKEFVSYVGSFSKLSTSVVSKTDSATYDAKLTLDIRGLETVKNFFPINHLIQSLDGLYWASRYFCKDLKLCNDALIRPYCKDDTCRATHYKDLSALGANQVLRSSANKALVFVTDDESKEMSSTRFLSLYANFYPVEKLKVFSFVTLSKTESPCGYAEGAVYKDLSKKTGGKVFNICDLDWRPHFEEIASALEKIIKNQFAIGPKRTVQSVAIDGKLIAAEQYKVIGDEVQINSPALREDSIVQIKVLNN